MPVSLPHNLEDFGDELEGHTLVEEIAHRVDKDALRLFPFEGSLQEMLVKRQPEAVAIIRLPHRLQPNRHPLRIAMLAPGTDLRAAGYRIPG